MVEHIPIPIELLEQFERGNVLLFVGEGINQGALPLSTELAEELAARCNYPSEDQPTLPRVAFFYERKRGRHELVTFMRERLWDHALAPLRIHCLISQLPVPIVVTTTYDDLLERAHREAAVPYVAVVSNQDVPYTDRQKRLLIWLLGRLDQLESLVLTEAERATVLADNRSLSDVLRAELAQRTWLILGFDLREAWFQSFYASVMRQLDYHGRRAYFYGDVPSDYIREWCKEQNIEILSPDVTGFLVELVRVLSGRKKAVITKPEEPPLTHPYKGLNAFTAADWRIFFGRKREVQRLTDLVRAHRLVVLYGASGTGKTSLAQAGLMPLLEGESPPYAVVVTRTLGDPIQTIRTSVAQKVGRDDVLPANSPLVDFLNAAAQALQMRLVLVLDQFEEFFQCNPQSRREFYAELSATVKARDIPVKIVLALREEWLAALSELEPIIPRIYDIHFRLLPLDHEAAREAVEKPVEPFGLRFEPVLVDRLLDDLGTEMVMPPQVQLVCEALYTSLPRGQREITLEHYVGLGGARGILGRFLNDELSRVPEYYRVLARGVLEELVTSQGTKAVKTVTELERSLGVRVDELQPILSALTGRLLRVVPREGAEQVYELAHEYLVAEIHLSAEALARKQAEELITQGVDNWKRLGTLLGKDTLALIDERREVVHPSLDAQELLLRSAIQHRRDVSYWAERMDANWRAALIQQLLADFDGPECPAREQATEALWALKRYLAWSVCVRVAWALAQQQSSAMIKRYALPVGFVLLLGIFLMASVIYVLNLPIPEKMVEVPAGEFIMGSTPEEVETRIAAMKETTTDKKAQEWWTGIFASEMPTRTVYVETFFVDKYEVTNAQYQRCVTAGVCKAPASWAETGTYPDGQGDYPVVNVSWQDADTYCQWAGRRLPTEVEWEKAARGTDGRRYPWGNEWEDGRANIKQGDRGAPTGVNSFLRDVSPYKVYNMAGNVWEWTASSWVEEAPFKVIRGGYWLSEPHRARCAARAGYPPDGSLKGAGVRCVSDQLWKPRGWREFIASVWR